MLTVGEYADALSKLPAAYLNLHAFDIRVCFYRNHTIVAHPDHAPLQWHEGEWVKVIGDAKK